MSLRPEISGFSLDAMFGPIGTKDEDVLARILRPFDESVRSRNPGLLEKSREVLRRAIFEEVPWPDLDVEGEAHVMAAIVLARYGQTTDQPARMCGRCPHSGASSRNITRDSRGTPGSAVRLRPRPRDLRAAHRHALELLWLPLASRRSGRCTPALAGLQDDDPSLRGDSFMGGFLDELWAGSGSWSPMNRISGSTAIERPIGPCSSP